MNNKHLGLLMLFVLPVIGAGCFGFMRQKSFSMDYDLKAIGDVRAIFPKTVGQLKALVKEAKANAQKAVEKIIAISSGKRTFENTARALDMASSFYFYVPKTIVETLAMVVPDNELRNAAAEAEVELKQFGIDIFGQNVQLYEAFKAYVNGNARKEALTDEHAYFLKEVMEGFRRSGLDLPEKQRKQVKLLEKKLAELTSEFSKNINEDKTFITATRDELDGLDEDFINNLKKTDDGAYILNTMYPTVFPIMEYCTVSDTRKRMYRAFRNKAYPANMQVLDAMISTRDKLAKALGYESYAALNIANEMAQTPERARTFIEDLVKRAQQKEKQEFEQLITDLPESVKVDRGKLWPWDMAFSKERYKKKHFQVDDREIKQYFPMEKTIQGLLDIYQSFFGVTFKKVSVSGLWNDDLEMIEAYKGDTLLGYLVLDLYPRPNKYSHACAIPVIPGLKNVQGLKPTLAVVVANFPKSTPEKPSLLELNNVRTFFHEFGHAVHAILGPTDLASFSGCSVKTDFVEMPSQMLEEWLSDAGILKQLSSHYQTGKPLSDELIEKIIMLKNFSSGASTLRQAGFALMALDFFAPGQQKDFMDISFGIEERLLPNLHAWKEIHMPCAWTHLDGYGAKYYSYLWSKVFALDLFDYIKKFGLLNPEIGKQYAEKVIGKGGSKDPNELLKDFLGREPNADAFFADLGLEK